VAWDQEKKDAVIAAYQDQDPTSENSIEIVKELAGEYEESPNGVRMILSKAGVYIKKSPATPSTKGAGGVGGGGTRISKVASQEALVSALTDMGAEVDEEIISKMTGKAAQYFTTVLQLGNSGPVDGPFNYNTPEQDTASFATKGEDAC